jgi:hypothetical protein
MSGVKILVTARTVGGTLEPRRIWSCLVSRELETVCLQRETRSRPIGQAFSSCSTCLRLHSISCLFLDLGNATCHPGRSYPSTRLLIKHEQGFPAAHVLKLLAWITLRGRLFSSSFVGFRGDFTLGVDRKSSRADDHTTASRGPRTVPQGEAFSTSSGANSKLTLSPVCQKSPHCHGGRNVAGSWLSARLGHRKRGMQ